MTSAPAALGTGRRALAMAAALGVVIVSTFHLETVFADTEAQVAVIAAAVVGLLVSLLLRRVGIDGAPLVFAHLAIYLAITAVVLFRQEGLGPGALLEAWTASTGGWNDLLRRPTPISVTAHLVAPVAMTAWAIMGLESEILFKSRRPAIALLPLTAFAAGFVLLATGPSHRYDLGASVAGLSLVHLWATTAPAAPAPAGAQRRSPLTAVVPALLVAALAGAAGTGLAWWRDDEIRFDPRLGLAPPIDVQTAASPLTGIKRQLITPDPLTLFTIEVDADAPLTGPLFIRQAGLRDYDGALWRSGTPYPVTGPSLAAGDPLGLADRAGVATTIEVTTTADYQEQYVPVIGDPTRVDAVGLGYSAETETLVARQPVSDSRFEIATVVTQPTVEQVAAASADADAVSGEFLAVPADVPEPFLAIVDSLDEPPGSGARLQQLADVLTQDRLGYSELAPSGHSIAALANYLGVGPREGAIQFERGVGYSEQGAALFALLARLDGYPTRVDVGYRVGQAGEQVPGTVTVTEDEAWAWVEVHLDGLGWVAFDPTPATLRDTEPPQPPVPPPRVEIPEPELVDDQDGQGEEGVDGSGPAAAGSTAFAWWIPAVSAVVVLLAVPWLLKRARRWRRLRRPDPARQLLGRWFEVRDRLRDLGLPVGSSFTPRETAGLARQSHLVGSLSATDSLARLTDTALYQPDEVTDEDVALAAELEDLAIGELAQVVGRGRRTRARLGARSLRRLGPVGVTPPAVHEEVAGL